ncbi:hypothetical protein DFH08DRAFT_883975 [Mycena albidolilacea]|uniref:Uncharacterized protein n=1 Tax=Mycena albidolilacea TaxID=1033008 RepID=A0AAD6ZM30_9AGAR|nr:hypothetical protein DFH08DRAFT_883975 [Mycena albidolilacea]
MVAEYLCSHITVLCFLPVYSLPTFCRSLLSHPWPPSLTYTPMCNLTGRFSCQRCLPSARCAVFIGSDTDPQTQQAIPRLLPSSSSEIC